MKRILRWAVLSLCVCGLAVLAQAQLAVDSISGPVTQNEINSFNTFMQGQSAPPDNTGDGYGHHTDSQRFDALGLMYIVSHDQGILDSYVRFVDTALHGRNDPNTGCIAWTGKRELFWPTGVNADGTCGASTNGEQGWVISHQAWLAELILRNPSLWNQTVRVGDPFGFGTTYLDRAKTYVRELDRSEDTYILKNLITNNQWRFPPSNSGYNGSTWFGLPFPWNQQMMLSGGLIRLANAHMILGDDPARVARYDSIVQESWNFWLTTDLASATCKSQPVYRWHYVNQSAPNTSIENTGHAAFDMWGLYMLTLGSGRYGVTDAIMTKFANTTASCIDLGSSWAQNIDGSGATQTNLQPQFFLLAKQIPNIYTRMANSDLSNAHTTPIYDAGLLWAKNARATGCWNDTGCSSGDFSLAASPGSQTVTAGNGTSYTATVTPSGGFTGTVGLSVSGLPSGASGTFTPASVSGGSGSSTLNVSTTTSTPAGTYTLTITGTSGSLSHTATATLTVTPPPDFALSASPGSVSVIQGNGASYTATIGALNGFSGSVALSVSGLPTGASGSFNPTSVGTSGSSTLSVTTSGLTPAGAYTLTITGTSGSLSHSTTVSLTVTASPNFTLSASPGSQSVIQGSGTTYTATVGALNSFSGGVALSVSGLPAGAGGSFNPTSIGTSGTSTLTVSTLGSTPTGNFTLTITGTSGNISHTATVSLTVNPPGGECTTTSATGTWNNTAFPSHSGSFTATFDATPSVNGQSSAVALSQGAQTTYSGFANLVVFTTAGTIQARNGGMYTAASTINFTGGNAYHFRLAINVTAHTYSIFVTAPGGTEQTVGSNYAFRTEQNTVTSLDHWGALVNATPRGTLKVCNFTAQ